MRYEFIVAQTITIETDETDFDKFYRAVVLEVKSQNSRFKIILDKTTDIEILESED